MNYKLDTGLEHLLRFQLAFQPSPEPGLTVLSSRGRREAPHLVPASKAIFTFLLHPSAPLWADASILLLRAGRAVTRPGKAGTLYLSPQATPRPPSRRAVRTVQLAVEIVGVEGAGELKDGVPPVQPGLLLPPV